MGSLCRTPVGTKPQGSICLRLPVVSYYQHRREGHETHSLRVSWSGLLIKDLFLRHSRGFIHFTYIPTDFTNNSVVQTRCQTLSTSQTLAHSILVTTLWGRHYYQPCFTDEEIGTERLSNLPKIIRLENVYLAFKPLSRENNDSCGQEGKFVLENLRNPPESKR